MGKHGVKRNNKHNDKWKVKEPLRKLLTTCQNIDCRKSALDGNVLYKCKGCQLVLYCNRECQKAAWPSHKAICKSNQNALIEAEALLGSSSEGASMFKLLHAFCEKHQATIAQYGVVALDLALDHTRSHREVVLVDVRRVPDATQPEAAFKMIGAKVVPLKVFDNKVLEDQLTAFRDERQKIGQMGGVLVVVYDVETKLASVHPVSFGSEVYDIVPGQSWIEPMMCRLNSGIAR